MICNHLFKISDYFLPSDLFSLPIQSNGQPSKSFDEIQMKRMAHGSRPTALPPIGGVLSNYVLLRLHPNPQNFLQFPGSPKENEQNKRETEEDSVVVNAESQQNLKNSDDVAEHKENDDDDDEDESDKKKKKEEEGCDCDKEDSQSGIAQVINLQKHQRRFTLFKFSN